MIRQHAAASTRRSSFVILPLFLGYVASKPSFRSIVYNGRGASASRRGAARGFDRYIMAWICDDEQ